MYRRLLAALFLLLCPTSLAFAQSAAPQAGFDVKAKQVYLIEAETGTVLFARAEDEAIPAASLAKLMTMASVFKALSAGETTLDTTYPVTEYAWRTGGAPSRTWAMSRMVIVAPSTTRTGRLFNCSTEPGALLSLTVYCRPPTLAKPAGMIWVCAAIAAATSPADRPRARSASGAMSICI